MNQASRTQLDDDESENRTEEEIVGLKEIARPGRLVMREGLAGWRRHLQMALGLTLSLLCLFLVIRNMQPELVWSTLSTIRPLPLLAAVGVEILTFWAIAVRWQRFFGPHDAPTVGRLFEILNIAQLINAVLPGKLGMLGRAYLAGQGEASGVAFAMTTIVGEKILEGLSLLLVAVGLLPFVPPSDWLRPTTGITAFLLLVVLGLMIGVACRKQTASQQMNLLLARWPRLLRSFQSALMALEVWRDPRAVLAIGGWSLFIWAITIVLNQLLLWSLDIQVPLVAAVLLLVVLQIGVRLPSSPGSIGVFHYLGMVSLSLFDVDKSVALSYGVILHLVTYLPASLLGLLFLGRAGYSLGQLRRAAGRLPAQTATQGLGDTPL